LFDNASIEAINPGSNDVMLSGDMSLWKKFVNTVKLKLLVRASSSSNASVQTWVNTSYPTISSVKFLNGSENS
jgi:hypothetical protein